MGYPNPYLSNPLKELFAAFCCHVSLEVTVVFAKLFLPSLFLPSSFRILYSRSDQLRFILNQSKMLFFHCFTSTTETLKLKKRGISAHVKSDRAQLNCQTGKERRRKSTRTRKNDFAKRIQD